jgi:hypothetical protein
MSIQEQGGWVGGVAYLGVEGWTRTECGTLIPPPGVSLGATTDFSMVAMDENGVLQFGLTHEPEHNRCKCGYCGQWGEPRTACRYCGAPIDPEYK